jgi:hypothetical protein
LFAERERLAVRLNGFALQVRCVQRVALGGDRWVSPFIARFIFGAAAIIWWAPPLLLGLKLCATRAGNAIPPQVTNKNTEGETNKNRDRQIEHFGPLESIWGMLS